VLDWHAKGEEAGIPALEKVAPLLAWAYVKDHRGLDQASDELTVRSRTRSPADDPGHRRPLVSSHDPPGQGRYPLYRIFAERIPFPEQKKAIDTMASTVPRERFPDVVAWMSPLIGHDDRENMTRIWQMVLPATAFAGVREVIKKTIGSDWAELTRRIPTLEP
jgi:hypothetical protein